MTHRWIADRTQAFDSSGIRKIFDLAAKLKDPINLSIGQPDFDVPREVQEAAIEAIRAGKNGYTPTQGIGPLVAALQGRVDAEYEGQERRVFTTLGASGALVLAALALVNPGDEVIVLDPYFVMYPPLISLAGGVCVRVETYPDFGVPLDRIKAAITPRTKLILFNSPGNPTGAVASEAEIRGLAELAGAREIALVSDEIYRDYCHDGAFVSPARFNPRTIVIDSFSKSHAMTGWRLGFAHGPSEVIEAMQKLQQYTFVCSPQPVQWAGLTALHTPMAGPCATYRKKRDQLYEGLRGDFELPRPAGAFYAFPKAPWGSGSEFAAAAQAENLLVIPGGVFSGKDTHFRISYAASDETLARGVEVLCRLARRGAKE
jgi:aspartate/methionine/tyrosine aminotransferase